LKWEKGEDSGAQEGKGEAGLGNKGELHLILLADNQTPTTASTHTHTPTFIHFVFCTFAAK
jgi:hypothetical protein